MNDIMARMFVIKSDVSWNWVRNSAVPTILGVTSEYSDETESRNIKVKNALVVICADDNRYSSIVIP
ncbi:MAG: hypothetical protein WAK50_08355 [Nitrososphaeraceae archaeon]|jgi:hypothetical protein